MTTERNNQAVGFVRAAAAIAWKDLRVEWRSREIVYTMLFFGAMVILVASFSLVSFGAQKVFEGNLPTLEELDTGMVPPVRVILVTEKGRHVISSGIIWIALLFAGTLGLSRAFGRERQSDTMRGLLLSPAPRSALFLGKTLSIAAFVLVSAVVIVPMVAFLFGSEIFRNPVPLVLLLVFGIAGMAVTGSTFAGVLLRSRAREVLLPVILYPILVPLLIAVTKGTTALLQPNPDMAMAWFWIKFALVYDVLFTMVALWSFESMVIE